VYRADVSARAAANTTTASKTPSEELRGNVLEVLKTLLAEGHSEAVLALFAKLVSRNSELEARLAKLLHWPLGRVAVAADSTAPVIRAEFNQTDRGHARQTRISAKAARSRLRRVRR
jgi:hypothetical protein